MTSDPDIIVHDITEEDEFLVIACDGQHYYAALVALVSQ